MLEGQVDGISWAARGIVFPRDVAADGAIVIHLQRETQSNYDGDSEAGGTEQMRMVLVGSRFPQLRTIPVASPLLCILRACHGPWSCFFLGRRLSAISMSASEIVLNPKNMPFYAVVANIEIAFRNVFIRIDFLVRSSRPIIIVRAPCLSRRWNPVWTQ